MMILVFLIVLAAVELLVLRFMVWKNLFPVLHEETDSPGSGPAPRAK